MAKSATCRCLIITSVADAIFTIEIGIRSTFYTLAINREKSWCACALYSVPSTVYRTRDTTASKQIGFWWASASCRSINGVCRTFDADPIGSIIVGEALTDSAIVNRVFWTVVACYSWYSIGQNGWWWWRTGGVWSRWKWRWRSLTTRSLPTNYLATY